MVHPSFLFDFGRKKSGCVFQLRRTQPLQNCPVAYWLYEIVCRTDSGLKQETPRFLVKKRGASMKNEGLEFFIQNPRQAA